MIKVEAIQQFTLGRFNEISNLTRKRTDVPGTIFTGDTFECSKELAEYLTGKNDKGVVVVKVIEVIPDKVVEEKKEEPKVEIKSIIKKATKKKSSKK